MEFLKKFLSDESHSVGLSGFKTKSASQNTQKATHSQLSDTFNLDTSFEVFETNFEKNIMLI